MKIGVLELDQALCEVPRHLIRAGQAKKLVKELRWAVELGRDRIKIVVAYSWSVIKAALRPIKTATNSTLPGPRYIPEQLPPPEVPGVKFREPISAIWRRDPSSPSLAVRSLPLADIQNAMLSL